MKNFIKTPEQIEGIRKSCRELGRIFSCLAPLVVAGASTADLENEACRLIALAGGVPAFKGYKTHKKAKPFPSALCISINQQIVHGPAVPARIFQAGDIVSIDVGMELGGYYSDMARSFLIGAGTVQNQKLVQVTRRALELGIKQMKPGNTLNDVGTAIQKWVESQGFNVVRDLVGHGVGLGVHEDPQIPHYNIKESGLPNVRLAVGMVLALEPMVVIGDYNIVMGNDGFAFETKDGQPAAHFEDTILIGQYGPENLTSYE